MSIEAMKMALEAMEAAIKSGDWKVDGACDPDMALVALRAAIEQAEQQEPVGKFAKFSDGVWKEVTEGSAGVLLYTSPPPRLIAAAPDLLSALDDLARYADTCELFLRETHPGKADMLRKRVTAAIDAMAKATGGEV